MKGLVDGTDQDLNEPEKLLLINRSARFMDELFDGYASSRSRLAIQDRLLNMVDIDAAIVGTQAGMAFVTRANAEYTLSISCPAPGSWLRILTGDGFLYVG